MKVSLKAVCGTIICCGMFLGAHAQINLLSDQITFRASSNANKQTIHYGDLKLDGGTSGLNYGWIYTNKMMDYGDCRVVGSLIVSGTKQFIQPHPTDTTKVIRYIAIEAGEAMTLVRGTAKTSGGTAIVTLPEHFPLVTSSDVPVTVLLTPENAPVLLYTSAKSKESITVVIKPSDFREFGDVSFSWQVCGVRDGFENEEIISDAATFDSGADNSGKVSEKRAKINERTRKMVEKISDKPKQKNSR